MTENEWNLTVTLLTDLFPTMADKLNPEQIRQWRTALDPLDNDRVRLSLSRWYSEREGWPVLSVIVSWSKPDRLPRGTYRPDSPLSDEDRQAYKAGIQTAKELMAMPSKERRARIVELYGA